MEHNHGPAGGVSTTSGISRRRSEQKDAVRAELSDRDEFVSARELHRRLTDSGVTVGIATVYRQLNSLAADGKVDVIASDEGERLFRACRTMEHHHHIVCRSCGIAVEFELPTEDWLREVSRVHGFTDVSHIIEVFGICADCAAARECADPAGRG
jgi:Fur family ferric uptake transcriptional regulator